jgi:8-oxo-dGTP pyrophosphatase MutT (NUDIX family)
MRAAEAPDAVEVLLLRRHIQSDFAPDVFVFPGGTVTAGDRQAETEPAICAPAADGVTALGSGFRAATIRECFEESGVLLAHAGTAGLPDQTTRDEWRTALQGKAMSIGEVAHAGGLVLATDALMHWAHWITPEAWPKRFDTHFFLAEMPAGQHAAPDESETTHSVWMTPERALDEYEAARFPLVFATIHQLRALSGLHSAAEARQRFGGKAPEMIMPRVVERDGHNVILMPGEE